MFRILLEGVLEAAEGGGAALFRVGRQGVTETTA
jgi:hypothetical protein